MMRWEARFGWSEAGAVMNWAISEQRPFGDDYCVGVAGIGDWRTADAVIAALLEGEPESVRATRCHRSHRWREGVPNFCSCGHCWGFWMPAEAKTAGWGAYAIGYAGRWRRRLSRALRRE